MGYIKILLWFFRRSCSIYSRMAAGSYHMRHRPQSSSVVQIHRKYRTQWPFGLVLEVLGHCFTYFWGFKAASWQSLRACKPQADPKQTSAGTQASLVPKSWALGNVAAFCRCIATLMLQPLGYRYDRGTRRQALLVGSLRQPSDPHPKRTILLSSLRRSPSASFSYELQSTLWIVGPG